MEVHQHLENLKAKKKNALITIIIGWVLLFVATLFYNQPIRNFEKGEVFQAEQQLHVLELESDSILNALLYHANTWEEYDSVVSRFNSDLEFYVEDESGLVYWTDNTVSPIRIYDTGFYNFPNGWYEVIVKKGAFKNVYAVVSIKRDYRYGNKYLKDHFLEPFSLPSSWELSSDSSAFSKALTSLNGKKVYLRNIDDSTKKAGVFLIMEWLGLFCFIIGLFYFFIEFENKLAGTIFFLLSLSLSKILFTYFDFPKFVYSQDIFSFDNYKVNSFFQSLGDIFLTGLLLITFIIFIYKNFRAVKLKINPSSKGAIYMVLGISVALIYSLAFYFVTTVSSLANVPLDFTNILDFDVYSLITYTIIATLFIIAHLVGDIIFSKLEWSKNNLTLFFWSGTIVTTVVSLILIQDIAILGIILIMLLQFWHHFRKIEYTIGSGVLIIFGYAIISSLIMNLEVDKREIEWRLAHALDHANERDFIAENLMGEMGSDIEKDPIVREYVSQTWDKRDDLNEYLKKYYFNAYWSKFMVFATAVEPVDSMVLEPSGTLVHCNSYFSDIFYEQGEKISDNLYFIENASGITAYIAKFNPIGNINLYIEFDTDLKDIGLGFPELLTDEKLQIKTFDPKYSYAKYSEGELISSTGAYSFPFELDQSFMSEDEFIRIQLEDMDHLVHHYGSKTIVISKPYNKLVGWATSFSYQFCFFSIFSLVFFGLWIFISKKGRLETDFKGRLQLSMLSILLASLVMVAVGTIYYLVDQNDSKNQLSIKEKIQSVQIEIEHKLADRKALGINDQEYYQHLMTKFSKVFFTDISLYDPQGRLLASSQPKVFSEGLTSPMINPNAFKAIVGDTKSMYIHNERVGELDYISAYVPFTNDNNELIGVLNLPYFAKQTELQSQINQFLLAIINIYVLLVVLAIIVTVLIYQRLTRPLRLIQDKFKKISLSETNELIEWKGKDELSDLVQAYNKLIIELGDSAEKLAQSEREGAWKEMARQVAHEIKNPLTPMKLSIQHLQRVADPNDPDFADRVAKVSSNLIEQIDALSNIATEFSSFAKMPDPSFDIVDLKEVMDSTCELYKREENIILKWNTNLSSAKVNADKDQLLRIFNNLIKNAIQATESKGHGLIEVSLERTANDYQISIKDNGVGISKENGKRIFVPNFTTKSSGSGLGLAMVKNMIELMSGSIWFDSEEGVGTTFYVKIPMGETGT